MAPEDLCHFNRPAKRHSSSPVVHSSKPSGVLKPADARFQERMGQQLAVLQSLIDQHDRNDAHRSATRTRLRQMSQARSAPDGGRMASAVEQREAQQQRYQVKLRRHIALLEETWNAQHMNATAVMV